MTTPKPTPTLAESWWEIYNEGDSPTEALALKIRAALERLEKLEQPRVYVGEKSGETFNADDVDALLEEAARDDMDILRAENAALKLESKDFLSVLARIASIALAHGWKNDGEYLLSAFINDTLNAAESRCTALEAQLDAVAAALAEEARVRGLLVEAMGDVRTYSDGCGCCMSERVADNETCKTALAAADALDKERG